MSCTLWLLIVSNCEVWIWAGFQWRDIHNRICQKKSQFVGWDTETNSRRRNSDLFSLYFLKRKDRRPNWRLCVVWRKCLATTILRQAVVFPMWMVSCWNSGTKVELVYQWGLTVYWYVKWLRYMVAYKCGLRTWYLVRPCVISLLLCALTGEFLLQKKQGTPIILSKE